MCLARDVRSGFCFSSVPLSRSRKVESTWAGQRLLHLTTFFDQPYYRPTAEGIHVASMDWSVQRIRRTGPRAQHCARAEHMQYIHTCGMQHGRYAIFTRPGLPDGHDDQWLSGEPPLAARPVAIGSGCATPRQPVTGAETLESCLARAASYASCVSMLVHFLNRHLGLLRDLSWRLRPVCHSRPANTI